MSVPTGEDAVLGGRLRLRQAARGHRVGTDAILLAASAPTGTRNACDLGAGVGSVGLILAALDQQVQVMLVERAPDAVALARENILLNGFDARVDTVMADVAAIGPTDLPRFDLVLANPPFHDPSRTRRSPDPARAAAHVAQTPLVEWVACAARLLAPRGHLRLIHRADALAQVLAALRPKFGSIAMRFVQPRAEADAIRLLLAARLGGRGPLTIRPPLILHEADGAFTAEAEAIHRGQARIDLGG